MALFLDNRHRLIACEELFQGTINAAPVYPARWCGEPCCTMRQR